MTIFIEIETATWGTMALNTDKIIRITPADQREDGVAHCYILTEEASFTAIGKSYTAIMALLRTAGVTTIMRKNAPGWTILRDGEMWNTQEATLGDARDYVRRMTAYSGDADVKWQILDAQGVEHEIDPGAVASAD